VQVLHAGLFTTRLHRARRLGVGAVSPERTGGDARRDEREHERDETAAQGRGTHRHHGSEGPSPNPRTGIDPDNLLESLPMSDDATAARAEWRAEEAQWSLAALEQWEHARDLADVARECMHRGDDVTFAFPSIAWTGALLGVGTDVARVAAGATIVDVRLAATAPFVLRTRPAPDGGRRGDPSVTTFAARLRELDGTRVCIGLSAGLLEGALRVGRDQVRVADGDGGCAYVPIGSVWWVRPLDDD
jgi:hypothetical protein